MKVCDLCGRRIATALVSAAAMLAATACGDATRPDTQQPSTNKAANGIDGLTAQQIYERSRAANAAAGSYREQMTRADAKTNLLLSATACSGTVEVSGQGTFQIITKDRDVWAKLDAAIAAWASEQGGITIPARTWLHGTPDHPLMGRLASWCHTETVDEPDKAGAKLAAQLKRGPVTTLPDGQQAVPISIEANGNKVTWYAAATGTPHYIRQDATRADMEDVTYSEFGTPVNAKAPAGKVAEAPAGSWPNSKLQ
ncbi:hypothetical protein [Streptomyces chartreusis]|uniref:hypothetical protein n=1 Tax=Streptomyces chartreusis TaxID=1969 RepID=UPI0016728E87|nr:hypothetical protein [Streptomyces chartreusis]GGX58044.1 hypothetical protein GCM10010321_88720 [Streptomyces chartreusis]